MFTSKGLVSLFSLHVQVLWYSRHKVVSNMTCELACDTLCIFILGCSLKHVSLFMKLHTALFTVYSYLTSFYKQILFGKLKSEVGKNQMMCLGFLWKCALVCCSIHNTYFLFLSQRFTFSFLCLTILYSYLDSHIFLPRLSFACQCHHLF